jgi:hypothetical protein
MAHPYQKLIQHHSERIHIRTRVDIPARGIGLLRTHVTYGPDDDSRVRVHTVGVQIVRGRLGRAEIVDSWHRLAVDIHDQNIGWLQIAMNDGLLMRALHVVANLDEQLQPLAYG